MGKINVISPASKKKKKGENENSELNQKSKFNNGGLKSSHISDSSKIPVSEKKFLFENTLEISRQKSGQKSQKSESSLGRSKKGGKARKKKKIYSFRK